MCVLLDSLCWQPDKSAPPSAPPRHELYAGILVYQLIGLKPPEVLIPNPITHIPGKHCSIRDRLQVCSVLLPGEAREPSELLVYTITIDYSLILCIQYSPPPRQVSLKLSTGPQVNTTWSTWQEESICSPRNIPSAHFGRGAFCYAPTGRKHYTSDR